MNFRGQYLKNEVLHPPPPPPPCFIWKVIYGPWSVTWREWNALVFCSGKVTIYLYDINVIMTLEECTVFTPWRQVNNTPLPVQTKVRPATHPPGPWWPPPHPTGITGLCSSASVHSDVAFWSFDVSSSYHCEAEFTKC